MQEHEPLIGREGTVLTTGETMDLDVPYARNNSDVSWASREGESVAGAMRMFLEPSLNAIYTSGSFCYHGGMRRVSEVSMKAAGPLPDHAKGGRGMRRSFVVAALITMVLVAGVCRAEECTTVGVRDCRASNQPGVCYWWECQQTGSVKQMIFLGQKCTCPQSELNGGARFAKLVHGTASRTCGQPVPPLLE